MFTRTFWAQSAERAIKTFAQAALAVLTVGGLNLMTVHWGSVAATAGLAALISVLTSIASSGVGGNSPSLVRTTAQPGPAPETAATPVPAK
jgi:hypothetical protein